MSYLRTAINPIAARLNRLARVTLLPLVGRAVPRDGVTVHRDLAYGPRSRNELDLYVPDGLTAPAPVLLFFYGGSWQSGSKDVYDAFGRLFAHAGIVTAIADYRLYPEVKYPAFLEDGADAITFLHRHVADYGGDPERLFVAGHSAGAYIAVMLAVNDTYLKAADGETSWIRGVIGLAGPYDFLPLYEAEVIDIFGGAREMATQPIKYAGNPAPPMLLAHGLADKTVGAGNSRRMAERLLGAGNKVELKGYLGIGHIAIVLSLLPPLRKRTTLYADMLRFLRAG
ncbi:MAG TPA: alpha/beta hydrolase [Rhizomicrobium sp.]|nr:alpha/beta hydrolase [Rhizomicrobium sp.]